MKADFHIETDIKVCLSLWEKFSNDELLTDNWAYRFCFHKGYQSEPYFIVGKVKDTVIGFLPLEYDKKTKSYAFFGGGFGWNEQMRFVITEQFRKNYLNQFVAQIPQNSRLRYLHPDDVELITQKLIPEEDPSYYLLPTEFNFDMEQYMAAFSPRSRKNLRKSVRRINDLNPKISEGNIADIDFLVRYNIGAHKKESLFHDKYLTASFKNLLLEPSLKDHVKIVSVVIAGQVESVSIYAVFKGTLTYLEGSSNLENQYVTRYLDYHIFAQAFEKKITMIDALSGDCGWKERWRLKKQPLFELVA